MRRTKGFTLVELLVVIAIIALLMGILMPALARVRAIAQRIVCGTNLSGIGKAMLMYANDYQEELPLAGWSLTSAMRRNLTPADTAWRAETRDGAFGATPGIVTVTSCFYALVKFTEITPKSFICKADAGVTEFKLPKSGETGYLEGLQLIDCWDFGPATTPGSAEPDFHCSYSYHMSYGGVSGTPKPKPLTTSSEPGLAVAADPNPWFIHASNQTPKNFPGDEGGRKGPFGSIPPFKPDQFPDKDHMRYGNAIPHQEDGQNVLFLDGHVNFETKSTCGVDDDNIYTRWSGTDTTVGTIVFGEPADRKDSFLINNYAAP